MSGGRKSTPMTSDAKARIQSHADRTNSNQGFKARAQSAADRNVNNSGARGASQNTPSKPSGGSAKK